jgi:hypothetical protein
VVSLNIIGENTSKENHETSFVVLLSDDAGDNIALKLRRST